MDLPLRCRCGRLRGLAGNLSPTKGFHLVCYCKDCQAFARFLGRADLLDPAGGTEIFQMPPGRMTLTAGTDALRCLGLSSKVLRWYADCCRTPVANTPARPGFPVIGVVHSFIDRETGDLALGEALGPPVCGIHARSAIGPLPANAPAPPSARVQLRRASLLLRWWLGGLGRPTPFFDDVTNAPRAAARMLTPDKRAPRA